MAKVRKSSTRGSTPKSRAGELVVDVKPFGPTPQELHKLGARVLQERKLKAFLGRSRHRLLTVEALEPDGADKSRRTPAAPHRFRATIYDETNHRTVLVEAPLARPSQVEISESSVQPPVTAEEFSAAVRHVARHPELGAAVRDGTMMPYAPMPPPQHGL